MSGQRAYGLKLGHYSQRLSIIGGLSNRRIIAPFIFEGHCNSELFCTWIKKVLVQELVAGQTVIMDNARFHKSDKVKKLIEKAGCYLLYLPPYSPDLNPIEHKWFEIKNKMRKYLKRYDGDLYKCAFNVFNIRKHY